MARPPAPLRTSGSGGREESMLGRDWQRKREGGSHAAKGAEEGPGLRWLKGMKKGII